MRGDTLPDMEDFDRLGGDTCPQILLQQLVGHGIAASRLITSKMTEESEAEMIDESLDFLEKASGQRPQGWFSPEGVESSQTPALLAAAGVR